MITAGDFLKWLEVFDVQFGSEGPITIPVPVSQGGTGRTTLPTTYTASSYAAWDTNSNISANNFIAGYTTTATAAAVTSLTVASTELQYMTGATTQTVKLPTTASLVLGQSFYIVNNSTGVVTVESYGTNSIQAMASGSTLYVTCLSITSDAAAAWNAQYSINSNLHGAITTIDGDSGSITPSAGVVTISGGSTGLTTSGSSATLDLVGTLAIAHGGTGFTSVTTAPAASAWSGWDANKNLSANNLLASTTFTATAASTTALTVGSTYLQFLTGATTQTITLPSTASLVVGQSYVIVNGSTGVVTVESYGSNVIQAMAANTRLDVICITTLADTAAAWAATYYAINYSLPGYTTTVTSAGTVALTVSSTALQYFTGSTASQVVTMPVTSTLALGQQYTIVNNSTVAITVESSGGNTIQAMATLTQLVLTCISLTGTGTASWSWQYQAFQNANGNTIASDLLVDGLTVGKGASALSTNSAFGVSALAACTSGVQNLAIGYNALLALTSGSQNVAIGYDVLKGITTASNNTAVGWNSMPTGGMTGSGNTGVGVASLASLNSGSNNCSFGLDAGQYLTSGSYNTMYGYSTGTIANGGTGIATGQYNILIGYQCVGSSSSQSGAIGIGCNLIIPNSTGTTSATVGPALAIGSSAYPVGVRGDGSLFPGNTSGGYIAPQLNGTVYQIPVFASGTTGSVLLTSQTNTTASGIAQYLDKGTGNESSNAVTINHQAGTITTSSLTTAASSTYVITLTNSLILSSSNVILVTISYGTNTTEYVLATASCTAASTAVITLYNSNAVSALNGTMYINFVIF